jgi:hypothetical protein
MAKATKTIAKTMANQAAAKAVAPKATKTKKDKDSMAGMMDNDLAGTLDLDSNKTVKRPSFERKLKNGQIVKVKATVAKKGG